MNFNQFFDELYLHDSVVNNCQYLPGDRQLTLELELCNYLQDNYQVSQPEIIQGKLIFKGLSQFKSQPSLEGIRWGEKTNGQILDVNIVGANDSNSMVEIIMEITDYTNNSDKIYKLNIVAQKAAWTP